MMEEMKDFIVCVFGSQRMQGIFPKTNTTWKNHCKWGMAV